MLVLVSSFPLPCAVSLFSSFFLRSGRMEAPAPVTSPTPAAAADKAKVGRTSIETCLRTDAHILIQEFLVYRTIDGGERDGEAGEPVRRHGEPTAADPAQAPGAWTDAVPAPHPALSPPHALSRAPAPPQPRPAPRPFSPSRPFSPRAELRLFHEPHRHRGKSRRTRRPRRLENSSTPTSSLRLRARARSSRPSRSWRRSSRSWRRLTSRYGPGPANQSLACLFTDPASPFIILQQQKNEKKAQKKRRNDELKAAQQAKVGRRNRARAPYIHAAHGN